MVSNKCIIPSIANNNRLLKGGIHADGKKNNKRFSSPAFLIALMDITAKFPCIYRPYAIVPCFFEAVIQIFGILISNTVETFLH